MKTREQIIADNPLELEMSRGGVKIIGEGKIRKAKCPFHDDKNPSMSIDTEKGLFHCHGCKASGSVIDYVARSRQISVAQAMKDLAGEEIAPYRPATAQRTASKPEPNEPPPQTPKIVAEYSYQDEFGNEVYQSLRLEPKSFRQRHKVDGKWVWNMDGVQRVLYRLPHVLKANAPFVWIVEGEKDADNLKKLGFVATTNVGGAGKWMEGYSDCLKGKELILCGDNDEPGRKHMAKVLESVANKAKTVRILEIPAPHKDVSDFIATFDGDVEKAAKTLYDMFESAAVLTGGVMVPVQGIAELEAEYSKFARDSENLTLDLACWLPSFRYYVRGLVPGELVTILAATGVGKTATLQNIAIAARPLETLMFELELPGTLTFERYAALATQTPAHQVFTNYKAGQGGKWKETRKLDHVYVCSKSNLEPKEIQKIILQTELKIGTRPKLVLVDYHQLIGGTGKSRYERASGVAEQMKVVAKDTGTIIIIASQVGRKKDGDGPEVCLYDGKDSGSIENSSGLVLGIWRDESDAAHMHVKILKNTKGKAGDEIQCNFNGQTMQITERSKIAPEDYPK